MESEKIDLVKYYCSQRVQRSYIVQKEGPVGCRLIVGLSYLYHVVHTLLCEVMVVTSDNIIVHHVPHPLIRKRHKECILLYTCIIDNCCRQFVNNARLVFGNQSSPAILTLSLHTTRSSGHILMMSCAYA